MDVSEHLGADEPRPVRTAVGRRTSSRQHGLEVSLRRYPFGVWLGILYSLALAVSAVYWSGSRVPLNTGASWGTAASVDREYDATTRRLTLPHGYEWPSETPFPAIDENGLGIAYGAGTGAQWAEWYWFDSWASVAVSATAPDAARDAAIHRLPEFLRTTAFANMVDQGQADYRKMIDEAQDGDLTELRSYVGAGDGPAEDGGKDE